MSVKVKLRIIKLLRITMVFGFAMMTFERFHAHYFCKEMEGDVYE